MGTRDTCKLTPKRSRFRLEQFYLSEWFGLTRFREPQISVTENLSLFVGSLTLTRHGSNERRPAPNRSPITACWKIVDDSPAGKGQEWFSSFQTICLAISFLRRPIFTWLNTPLFGIPQVSTCCAAPSRVTQNTSQRPPYDTGVVCHISNSRSVSYANWENVRRTVGAASLPTLLCVGFFAMVFQLCSNLSKLTASESLLFSLYPRKTVTTRHQRSVGSAAAIVCSIFCQLTPPT